jgi:hypothetical protein
MKLIREWILRWARNRQPDFVIGGHEHPYLRRHWLIPRNRFFNIYVHEFLRSDDDRALHDHPWLFNCSWIIEGSYREWVPSDGGQAGYDNPISFVRETGAVKFRWGAAAHRVELTTEAVAVDGPGWVHVNRRCWTVFVTGPIVREWGFHCPGRWVPWKEFVDQRDAGSIGKGCGE